MNQSEFFDVPFYFNVRGVGDNANELTAPGLDKLVNVHVGLLSWSPEENISDDHDSVLEKKKGPIRQ